MERNIPIVGKVVPNNPYDLMKQLRESEKMENSKLKQKKVVNRQKKQELQREYIEKRLMEAEDYCFTDEGLRRLRACEDRIRM
jgi:predicted DNA-binding protein